MRRLYHDIKLTLKVPLVNFIFRTAALYETFLAAGWQQVRLNMLTVNAEEAASTLRYPSLPVDIPYINWQKHYSPQQIEVIKRTVFTFNYVNPKLLLIASAWAESLANRRITGSEDATGYIEPGIMPGLPEIKLVHIPEAPENVRSIVLDIADVHQTYDAASDFRALANYPVFLSESWNHLRPFVRSSEYSRISAKLKGESIQLARQLPYPVSINRKFLNTYYTETEIAGIMGVVSMFQNILPQLIVDGEFFRRILGP